MEKKIYKRSSRLRKKKSCLQIVSSTGFFFFLKRTNLFMSSTFFLYEFNQQNYFTSKTFFSVFIYISLFLTSFCKPANPTSSVFSVSLFSLTTTTFPDGMLYHQACTTGPFFSQKNYYFKAWPVRAKALARVRVRVR